MIFQPHCQYSAALGVALLLLVGGCSVAAIAPITSALPTISTISTIPISQSTQSTSTAQNSPSFIKVVDAKHNPGLCRTDNMHSEVLNHINHLRAQGAVCGGVNYPPTKPLRWSAKLQQAADTHSHDMATHNYFNHRSVSNGSTLPERLRGVGYSYRAAGENLGAGPATVAQVIDMWVASPAHCVTMMTADFAELGVSCKNNSNSHYKTYWTLNAAAPF